MSEDQPTAEHKCFRCERPVGEQDLAEGNAYSRDGYYVCPECLENIKKGAGRDDLDTLKSQLASMSAELRNISQHLHYEHFSWFFLIGAVAGFALTGVQSVSRTMVSILSPSGHSAEFYGFFAVAGRTSSFIGPAFYGWLAAEAALWYQAQGQGVLLAEQSGQRLAILSIIAFLLIGLVLLLFVNETKGRAAEGSLEAALPTG